LVPRVKKAVQTLDSQKCAAFLAEVRDSSSATEIFSRCESIAREHYPELLT
jgi:hypothetical protein